MALEQDTVSIDIAVGVNNKVDDKIAGPEQASTLRNARFDKDKRLTKRNGITAQASDFQGQFFGEKNFINPVVFGSVTCQTKTFVHQDQLCLETNGNLFSQYDGQDKWVWKGTYVPISIDVNRLDANINFTDTVTVQGVTVSCGSQSIYVSEEKTGTIISKMTLPITEVTLRPIGFSNRIYVLTNSSASFVMNAREINMVTGSVGNQIAVVNHYTGYASPPVLTVTSSASAIGEAAFIVYTNSSVSTNVVPFLSTGTVHSLGVYTLSSISPGIFGVTIEPKTNPSKIYFAGQTSAQAFTFTASAYNNVWYRPYVPTGIQGVVSTNSFHAITTAVNPVNDSDLLIFTDFYVTQTALQLIPGAVTYSDDRIINFIVIGSGGATISNDIYSRGLSTAGNLFRDEERKTAYLPCTYTSPLQTSVLLCDVLEGRSRYNYLMGKTLYGRAQSFIAVPGGNNVFPASQTSLIGTNTYRIINNRYFVDFNLTPTYAPQSQFFANTTHLTGGMLWAYDGETIAEHNFLIGAEKIDAQAGQETLSISVTEGDGSNPEKTLVTLFPASAYNLGASQNRYLQFNTTINTVSAYFVVDGIGTNPNLPGAANTPIILSNTDTATEVALKLVQAINVASTGAFAVQQGGINQVVITNNNNANTPNSTVAGSNRIGSLSLGSYQYTFCYKWTDKNGGVYRSSTAPPVTVTSTGTAGCAIVLWNPAITNKTIKDVNIELYRTLVDATQFHYIDTILTMNSASARSAIFDTRSDAAVASSRLLYTDGGVLDNSNIGAVKTVSSFKERLAVGGLDEKSSVYYSKDVVFGEPVNFAEELFFNVDADEGAITAVASMDDKLITFKDDQMYAVSGDGANDLGQGSTLTPPFLIASDAGADNPNSVVLYPDGLLFKSSKGIYKLNRSLGVEYIGAPVEDFNSNVVSGAVLMKNQTEIRFMHQDTSTALVYNYYFNRWDIFDNYKCDSSALYGSDIVLARDNGKVMVENAYNYDIDSGSQSYSVHLETPWLKLKGIQDFQRIYSLMFLGEYLSPHTVTVNVSYDYDLLADNSQDYTFDATNIIGTPSSYPGGSVYQFEVDLSKQKCQAIKVKFTENPAATSSQSSLYLNNMSANVGLKRGLNKLPPDKRV